MASNKTRVYCKNHPEKRAAAHQLCATCYYHYRKTLPGYREKQDVHNRERRAKGRNPNTQRNWWFMRKYGITLADYQKMYNSQKGQCAICSGFYSILCVDHNHSNGKIRELLCRNCNLLLGSAKEDINLLIGCVMYLQKHENNENQPS